MPSYENPRSLPPTDAELASIYPDNGSKASNCNSCGHRVKLTIGSRSYDICVLERDDGSRGEVFECDPDIDCDYYEWDGISEVD